MAWPQSVLLRISPLREGGIGYLLMSKEIQNVLKGVWSHKQWYKEDLTRVEVSILSLSQSPWELIDDSVINPSSHDYTAH